MSASVCSEKDSGSLCLRDFAALFRRAAIKSSINIIYRLHTRYKCVKRSPLIAGRFEKLLKLFVFNFATESQSEFSIETPPLSSRHAQKLEAPGSGPPGPNHKQLWKFTADPSPFLLFAQIPWPLSNYKQLMKDASGGGDGGSGSGGGGGR